MSADRISTHGIPPFIIFITALSVPIWGIGWLPIWEAQDGRNLIFFLSGPLYISSCLVPLLQLRRLKQQRSSLAFISVCLIYLLIIGIRAYYFLFFQDLVLYPKFDPPNDLLYLHKGLLWATSGIWAMTLGFFFFFRIHAHPEVFSLARKVRTFDELLRVCSSPIFIFSLYGIGIIGRMYAMYVGSAIWLYNSPSFDTFADRQITEFSGLWSLLPDLCPLAFASSLAYWYQNSRLAKSFWYKFSLITMLIIEVAYFSFGLYKYGLLGILLILWLVSSIHGKIWSKKGVIFAFIFIFAILPIINSARINAVDYYTTIMRPTSTWVGVMRESINNAFDFESKLNIRDYIDPFIERLNGAEALAVAEKYVPEYGYEWGGTYLNLLRLVVPRFLRLWSSDPYYINWAVNYVGLSRTNPTVIPMPAIVEAYVNFGIIGVWLVMFLFGLFYWYVDRFSVRFAERPIAIGLFAYVVWRCINIEHNLFIFLPAVLKMVAMVLVLCWIYQKAVSALHQV